MNPIDRNTEALLLACALQGATSCVRRCGRLATSMSYGMPECDACGAENWDNGCRDELRQAKRVRRLEALLKGEA